MYTVIVFDEENSAEGVPNSWIVKKNGSYFCYWPQRERHKVGQLVKNRAPPSPSWHLFPCRIKAKVGTYEEMLALRKKAQSETTEIDSSEDARSEKSENDYEVQVPVPPAKRVKTSNGMLKKYLQSALV